MLMPLVMDPEGGHYGLKSPATARPRPAVTSDGARGPFLGQGGRRAGGQQRKGVSHWLRRFDGLSMNLPLSDGLDSLSTASNSF